MLSIPSCDLLIATLPMYDVLSSTGMGDGRVEGNLLLSGFQGFKEVTGSTINFGYDHTWPDTQMGHETGDKTIESGSFDMSKNQLVTEGFTERGGKKIQRSIYELVRLPNGSFIGQSMYSNGDKEVNCVFLKVKNDEAEYIIAKGEKNVDFSFKSIIDAGEVPITDMAQGYKVVLVVKIVNGNVTFEKT